MPLSTDHLQVFTSSRKEIIELSNTPLRLSLLLLWHDRSAFEPSSNDKNSAVQNPGGHSTNILNQRRHGKIGLNDLFPAGLENGRGFQSDSWYHRATVDPVTLSDLLNLGSPPNDK
ncbi:hypothetical protein AAFF_G00207020 [Aldrovandia affinis]|uniref:Uncharacterized protein n=1 Tax=Aldrovandia affinis TaxID=143900 RepID=A0AAD7RH93_9TELE|nr:hypothetical protein AAFF_G00207020 [Aldrovandia affinis]